MRRLLKICSCLISLSFIASVFAEKLVWKCSVQNSNETILTLVQDDQNSHLIFSGQKIPTGFSLEGLERQWIWRDNSPYAVFLGLDNKADYWSLKVVPKFSKKKPQPIESFNCDSVGNDSTEKYEDSSD